MPIAYKTGKPSSALRHIMTDSRLYMTVEPSRLFILLWSLMKNWLIMTDELPPISML